MRDRTGRTNQSEEASRRSFLKQSAGQVAGAAALVGAMQQAAHAAGIDETIRIGLIGCGGRGTGAVRQALLADSNTRLIAMADAFESRLANSIRSLKATDIADRVAVAADHQFVGLDAYRQLLATDVDVVLLTTPPGFRPIHLQAAIDAGKHVFAEKPVAVDPAGVQTVLAASREAAKKRLLVVSGLQTRYEPTTQELVQRIHEGAIGDLVYIRTTRYGRHGWTRPRDPGMTDVAYQVNNWYHFAWTSGDFIAEQFVHELDRVAWIMNDYPISCMSTGGRQTRIGPDTGHVYDHFSTIFKYKNGVELHAATRQQVGCQSVFELELAGTRGRCNGQFRNLYKITGENPTTIKAPRGAASRPGHQLEHNAMYAALRNGEYINNGDYMAKSTMMAIMARDAAYAGQQVNWQQIMDSGLSLVNVGDLTWDSELPEWHVAMPGMHGILG